MKLRPLLSRASLLILRSVTLFKRGVGVLSKMNSAARSSTHELEGLSVMNPTSSSRKFNAVACVILSTN